MVKRLEEYLGKPVLQLACRHHIAELFAGAACSVIYGDSESPTESCHTALCQAWDKIDTNNYVLPNIQGRLLKQKQQETVSFLEDFLSNEDHDLRDDYKEMAELTLLYLGGTLPKGIKIYAPGASHRARWMASILYSLKISLFREQLQALDIFDSEPLDYITSLSIFLALFYVKYWFCCTSAPDAPKLDLDMLSLLETYKSTLKDKSGTMNEMITAILEKFRNHLWYLSERLVPLSLFSYRTPDHTKSSMAKMLIKSKGKPSMNVQAIPVCKSYSNTQLKDLVGPDSWAFFNRYGVQPLFLSKPVNLWTTDTSYIKLLSMVCSTKVVNDTAERSLGLLTEFNTGTVTKSEEQKQYLYKVIREMRRNQKNLATSRERCTKASIKKLTYYTPESKE